MWLIIFPILLITIYLTYTSVIKLGTCLNHYTLYTIASLGSIALYYYKPIFMVADNTIILYIIGTFFYNSSILFYKKKDFNIEGCKNYIIPIKIPIFITMAIFVLLIPFVSVLIGQLQSGMELWLIRKTLRIENVRSTFENMISLYLLLPFSMVITVLSYYKNFTSSKYDKILITSSFLIVIAISLIDGGARTIIMEWLFVYFIVIIYKKSKFKNIINSNGKLNLWLLSVPIIAGIVITSQRGITGDDKSFLDAICESFTIHIGLLDYFINNEYFDKTDLTLGLSTFENFYLMINLFFKTLFGIDYIFGYSIVDNTIQDYYLLNNGEFYNAYVSLYFRFYRDWGWVGIILGPILLSSFLTFLYRKSTKNSFYFLIYLYSLAICPRLNQELLFSKVPYFLFILYMIIIYKIFVIKYNKKIRINYER